MEKLIKVLCENNKFVEFNEENAPNVILCLNDMENIVCNADILSVELDDDEDIIIWGETDEFGGIYIHPDMVLSDGIQVITEHIKNIRK